MAYKRVLIKLSGEMLGSRGKGFSAESASAVTAEISPLIEAGIQTSVLVGGGNIVRAKDAGDIDRITADFMGMVGTVINGLGLRNAFEKADIPARVLSAVRVSGITEEIIVERADRYLRDGEVVIFSGGTGSPFFTTDTAAAIRALEIGADILLKATKVKGVFSDDPEKNGNVSFIPEISYSDAIEKRLGFMDSAAMALLAENGLKSVIFNFSEPGNLMKAAEGRKVGTVIS